MFNIITSSATIINPQLNGAIHDMLLNGLQVVLLGMSVGISYGIKLWINSMKSGWKKTIAERLVKFAEQRIESNHERLAYVSRKMSEHFPRLNEEEIDHLVEEAVANLQTPNTVTIAVKPESPLASIPAIPNEK